MTSAARLLYPTCVLALIVGFSGELSAQRQRSNDGARSRITQPVDDTRLVVRGGTTHPLTKIAADAGAVASDLRMERMILVLEPSTDRQEALEELLAAQHDPSSPEYQKWLTPEEFGERFGVTEAEVATVRSWLENQGFEIEEVTPGRRSILFHGSAMTVEKAFHTSMRRFSYGGREHVANSSDISIPEALVGVVHGVVSLNSIPRQTMHSVRSLGGPVAELTSGSAHYMSPADFATIYDVNALYAAGIDGTGQTIAIVGRSNINVADVTSFRSKMGLPANNPVVILNGVDPGQLGGGELTEALLDVQWAGAVAKKATVKFVVSKSTSSADGVDLSAQYIVSRNLAPVLSVSFGACERWIGTSGNAFYNSLWQQAAAQGITAFISSGDSGAAGCDGASASRGANGQGINGLCSSPYAVCVGGTQFAEGSAAATYWSGTTNPTNYSSALSYIPEAAWNESGSAGGSGLWSTGGGPSSIYAKPAWQTGPGVPADGKRDTPDVSLTAAGHDGYLIQVGANLGVVGGTSASSPALASLMALIVQKYNAPQGNANPTFYALAERQSAGGAAVFHDVKAGNNTVPGVTGFAAGTGYDMATGLGSVDGFILVNHWMDASSAPNFKVTGPGTATVTAGKTETVTVAVETINSFNSAVTLSVTGLPTGVTAAWTPATLAAPGAGTAALKFTAAATAAAGTYTLTIKGTAGTLNRTANVSLTVLPMPTFNLTQSAKAATVVQGSSTQVTVTTALIGAFNSDVVLSATGMPAGMTAVFNPATLTAPGSGSSTVTFSATGGVAVKSYTIALKAVGGGVMKSVNISVTVVNPLTLTAASTSLAVTQGSSASVNVTTALVGTFNSEVALNVTGLPAGATAAFEPSRISAPGSGTSALKITTVSTLAAKSYALTLSATGSGVTKTAALTLVVNPIPDFTWTIPTTATVVQGKTASVALSSGLIGAFNEQLGLSVSGLPSGVSVAFNPNFLKAPGSGKTTMVVSAESSAAAGTYTVVVKATGTTKTHEGALKLTVVPPPSLKVTAAATASVKQSGTLVLPVTSTVAYGFNSAVVFSVAGLPSGVTVAFSPVSLRAPGGGTMKLTFTVASSAPTGTYEVTVTGSGGGLTSAAKVALTVEAAAFTASMGVSTATLSRGQSVTVNLLSSPAEGGTTVPVVTVTGLPSGVSAKTATTAGEGGGQNITITLTATTTAKLGNATLTVTATGGGSVRAFPLILTVK